MLDDADAGGAGAHEVAARVQPHVTETLHDERLAAPAGSCAWYIKLLVKGYLDNTPLK